MKCQKCGNDLNSGKIHCSFCGAKNVFEGSTAEKIVDKSKINIFKRFFGFIGKYINGMTIFTLIIIIIIFMANK